MPEPSHNLRMYWAFLQNEDHEGKWNHRGTMPEPCEKGDSIGRFAIFILRPFSLLKFYNRDGRPLLGPYF